MSPNFKSITPLLLRRRNSLSTDQLKIIGCGTDIQIASHLLCCAHAVCTQPVELLALVFFFVQTLNRWHNHGEDAMDYLNMRSMASEMKETDNFSMTSELCGGIRIGFPLESSPVATDARWREIWNSSADDPTS